MKKFLIFTSFVLIMLIPAISRAQPDIGLKFSPALSVNRVNSASDTVSIDGSGVGIRFLFGPVLDFYLGKNYYITTGLLYAPQRASINFNSNNRTEVSETYGLQYLQIPILLKMLTNEISLDKRIYFNLGLNGEIKIAENNQDETNFVIEDFRFFNSSLHLGFGLEYRIGVSTRVQVGFGYNRGLINVVGNQVRLDEDISIKNDLLTMDFILMF